MSDGPTHAPDVEALLLSAAYALAREVTGAEELLAGGAVQRDRLDPGQLARIGEAPDGPPLALTYELARRIEANRETKPLQELVQDSRPTTSPRSREATEEAETPSLGAVPAYPTEVLPVAARTLVEVGATQGLPPALLGGSALAALATAVGPGSEIQATPTWVERAALWIVNVAPSGAGKSPAQRLAFAPLREWDRSLVEGDQPLLAGDLTVEALGRILNEQDGVTLDIDELSMFLRGMGEYKRRSGDRGRWLSYWSGDPVRVTRVGSGGKPKNEVDLYAPRPTVVICGGLQTPHHELLGSEDDGFRPRWLVHLAELMPEPGRLSDLRPPAGWERLLTGALLPRRHERRGWTLNAAARDTFTTFREGWDREARQESGVLAVALRKADIHLLRVALLFAEAEDPGAGGEVGVDAIERAAVVVDFALNCWRALPEQGSLGLSWRHKVLDEGVEKLRVWVEGRGGEATRRELQRAHVAGVRAASDLDALLERYEDTYPNCVVEVVPEHGGLPTRVVRAPARRPVLAPVSPLATVGEAVAARPRPDGLDATVAAGDNGTGDSAGGDTAGPVGADVSPGGNGKQLLGQELLAETHRLVIRAEAAFVRARARDRCSVCGSEKAEPFVRAGVTYYRCGHSEVLLLAAGASEDAHADV